MRRRGSSKSRSSSSLPIDPASRSSASLSSESGSANLSRGTLQNPSPILPREAISCGTRVISKLMFWFGGGGWEGSRESGSPAVRGGCCGRHPGRGTLPGGVARCGCYHSCIAPVACQGTGRIASFRVGAGKGLEGGGAVTLQLSGEGRGGGHGGLGGVAPIYRQLLAGPGLQPALCDSCMSAYCAVLGSLLGEGIEGRVEKRDALGFPPKHKESMDEVCSGSA